MPVPVLMMPETGCVFCSIESDPDAGVVLTEPAVVAFLDRRPLFHGHVLVIPRVHVETLTELPVESVASLFITVRRVSAAVEAALGADGSFVAINNRVSQSVPHLHVHVVPRRRGDGLKGFFWPRQPYRDAEEKEAVRQAIARALVHPP